MNNNIVFCLSFFIIIGFVIIIYAVMNKKENVIPKGDVFIGIAGMFFFTLGIVLFANYDAIFGNVEKDSELFYESAADSIYNDIRGDEDNSQSTVARPFN